MEHISRVSNATDNGVFTDKRGYVLQSRNYSSLLEMKVAGFSISFRSIFNCFRESLLIKYGTKF